DGDHDAAAAGSNTAHGCLLLPEDHTSDMGAVARGRAVERLRGNQARQGSKIGGLECRMGSIDWPIEGGGAQIGIPASFAPEFFQAWKSLDRIADRDTWARLRVGLRRSTDAGIGSARRDCDFVCHGSR